MLVYTEQVYQLIDSLQIFSIVSYNTAQEKKMFWNESLVQLKNKTMDNDTFYQ